MYVTVSVSMPPEMVGEIDANKDGSETRSEYIRRMIRSDDCLPDDYDSQEGDRDV